MYLCASTIDGASFTERLEAASAGGYTGIGLRPSHYHAARAEGLSDSDLRSRIKERRLEVVEIGFLSTVADMGVTAPLGVEVLSDQLRKLGPQETARRAADATRKVLASVRKPF